MSGVIRRTRQYVAGLGPSVNLLQLNGAIAVAGLLTSVALARALGPEARGVLAIMMLWPISIANVGLLGTHLYLSRQAAKEPRDAGDLYSLGRKAAIFLSVPSMLALVLVVWLSPLRNTYDQITLLLALIIIPFSMWNAIQVQVELGRNNIRNLAVARGGFTGFYLIVVLLLWAGGIHTADMFLAGVLLVAAVSPIIAAWVISRSLPSARPVSSEPSGISGVVWLLQR